MSNVDRRTILATGALALAGAKSAGMCSSRPESIFPVGTTTIPIVGETDVFPVRRTYCIGRNLRAHAREMGSDPNRGHRSSFKSRPTRSRTSPSARSAIILIPRSPRTIITRSNWWRR